MSMADRLKKMKPIKAVEADVSPPLPFWKEYAIKVCKEFNIKPPFSAIVWKHAKHNLVYLQGKVAMVYEKSDMDKRPLNLYGHYLIALFRKSPPWQPKS